MILKEYSLSDVDYELLRSAKEFGFSDRQLADFWSCESQRVKNEEGILGIHTTFQISGYLCCRI